MMVQAVRFANKELIVCEEGFIQVLPWNHCMLLGGEHMGQS